MTLKRPSLDHLVGTLSDGLELLVIADIAPRAIEQAN
jgi:hypothetical protein